MRHYLYTDDETFSDVPLSYGTVAYAASPMLDVMLISYAIDDGPERVWDRTADLTPPADYNDAMNDSDVLLVAHNSFFDRTTMNAAGFGLAWDTSIPRWRCTMVQAFAHGLPGKLETLGAVLGLPEDQQKLKTGKELINLFCKPRPKNSELRRATRETHPEQWAAFVEYSRVDTVALREIHKRLPRWNYPDNLTVLAEWFLDQEINDRGVSLDLDLAEAAVQATDAEKKRLKLSAQSLTQYDPATGIGVESLTKRDQLLGYLLAEHGVALPDLTADTLERRIADESLPRELRELLAMRLEANMTSQTKYKKALQCASADGRARGLLQFAGAARTLRWAGRVLQPQNFVRPTLKPEEIEMWTSLLKSGAWELAA